MGRICDVTLLDASAFLGFVSGMRGTFFVCDTIFLDGGPIVSCPQYSCCHGFGTGVITANPLMYFLHNVVGLLHCDAL